MVKSFFERGKNIFLSRQANILSAAFVIGLMVAVSRVLGLIRNRTFVHFFEPGQLDPFLAAFQLPDLIFEILVVSAMSSAFVPVFSKFISQDKDKEGWYVAGVVLNIFVLFFLILAILVFIFAHPIYSVIARGFSGEQVDQAAYFARILLVSQFFFIGSYVLTATLESNQRFLAPAVAPLFYNLGIIVFTFLFAGKLGLMAPVLGVVVGSFLHFLVQLPLAWALGFRPLFLIDLRNEGVRSVVKLAIPRALELSFYQIKRLTDLFLASLVVGGLTYFKFADALAAIPIGIFALPLAKASLPQLSRESGVEDREKFKVTFASSFRQILFLLVPVSVFMAVLRIPLVRLAFGAAQFDWNDTVQTGYVFSAFTLGASAYGLSLLLARAFYALHDTITPFKVTFLTVLINVFLGLYLVLILRLPIWGLAFSYSIAGIIQILTLFLLLRKRLGGFGGLGLWGSFLKVSFASFCAGGVMFILLKILDRSVWDKNLSFLGTLGLALPTTFDRFVLDTRYSVNLVFLTISVALIGFLIYVILAFLLRVSEVDVFFRTLRRIVVKGVVRPAPDALREEPLNPPQTNGS